MKIVDLKVQQLKPLDTGFKWKEDWPEKSIGMLLFRIITDEGIEGQCITWLTGPGHVEDALARLRGILIGRSPHDVEALSYELTDRLTQPTSIASAIDIALWDLIGKAAGLPVYKVLGAARHKVRAYASTVTYPTIDDYVKLAHECRAEGFTAFKLHAWGEAKRDIEVCRAVHAAVGDSMDLMLDPVNAYNRREAFEVGAALEEMNFFWYEAPIDDTDIQGLADLSRSFRVQIAGLESLRLGFKAVPPYLTAQAVDSVRAIGDWVGGISAMRKTAHLCEAFGINYEPHSYGSTLIQAAHFHVMLSVHNCELVELPVPTGILDIGMKDSLRVGADGYVPAPTKPGLGYEIDKDAIDDLTVRMLSATEPASMHYF